MFMFIKFMFMWRRMADYSKETTLQYVLDFLLPSEKIQYVLLVLMDS